MVKPGISQGRGAAIAGLIIGLGILFVWPYLSLGQISGLGSSVDQVFAIALLPVVVLIPLLSIVTMLSARRTAGRLASEESAYDVTGFTEYHRRRLGMGFDVAIGRTNLRSPKPLAHFGPEPEDGKTNTLTFIEGRFRGFNAILVAVNGRPLRLPVPAIAQVGFE